MLKVNTGEIFEELNKLNSYIDDYNVIKSSIFQELELTTVNWQDKNSIKFEESIYNQKKECDTFFNSIKSRKEIWQYIYDRYSKLGDEISVNLNSRETIIDHINFTLEKNYAAIDTYNYLFQMGLGYYYVSIAGHLASLGKKIDNITNQLNESKNKFNSLFYELEQIELEVKKKIKELEQINISTLNFNLK